MKCKLIEFILWASFLLGAFAQEPSSSDPIARALSSMRDREFDAALVQMEDIASPAAKLFVQASIERAQGFPERAIETVTQAIAQYPNDPDWAAKSELMSAALYVDLGMLDAAEATVRQIQLFHTESEMTEMAVSLQRRIEKLKNQKEWGEDIK